MEIGPIVKAGIAAAAVAVGAVGGLVLYRMCEETIGKTVPKELLPVVGALIAVPGMIMVAEGLKEPIEEVLKAAKLKKE